MAQAISTDGIVEALRAALDSGPVGMECNCGDVCTGTCAWAMVTQAIEQLTNPTARDTVADIIMQAEEDYALATQVEEMYVGVLPIPPGVFLYRWEVEVGFQIIYAEKEKDLAEKESTLRYAADVLNLCRRLRALGVTPIEG